MDLAEIITAASQKQLQELISTAMDGSRYKNVLTFIERRISRITLEEFKIREPEIRAMIANKVATITLSKLEVDCYAKIKE